MPDGSSLDQSLIDNGYEPIAVNGKIPVATEWQKRPNTIEALATEQAIAAERGIAAVNTGLRTGKTVGIDIDLRNPDHVMKLKALAAKVLGVPGMERIGAKGAMLVYRNATPIGKITVGYNVNGKPQKAVEILGTGQQFVAYGVHPDTKRPYTWTDPEIGDEPLQRSLDGLPEVTPDQLRDFAGQAAALLTELGYDKAKATGATIGRDKLPAPENFKEDTMRALAAGYAEAQRWIDRGDVPAEGNRNSMVAKLAARLRAIGLSEQSTIHVITVYLDAPGAEAPDEAVPDIVRSIYKSKPLNPPGSELPKTAAEMYGPAQQWEAAGGPGAAKPTASGLIRLQRLSEFLKRADPVELITDMMMEGEHCALCGPPKSGKSFLAIDLAMSLASARPIAGHHHANKHGVVIYLSGEGHAGMRRRLAAWGQHRGLTMEEIEALPFYYNEGVIPADISAEGLEAVILAIKETVGKDPVMVILDTMSRSLGGLDENASATAAMYLAVTEKLRSRLNTTFVSVVHASNKPGTKQLDIRGSSGFSAGFDAVWGIQKNTDNRTVAMSALWLKEADDLGPFYFRMRLVSPEGVAPTKRNTTVVLTYVAESDMAQEREAREKLLSNRDAVTANLARLGLIGQDRGQNDRDFAEAWHAPAPAGYIGYLHAKDARDVEAYTAGLAEEVRVELQNWLKRVDGTYKMLQEGARTKLKRDKSHPPTLAGLFDDMPNMRSGGKVERLWFLPAGWKPVAPELVDF